MWDSDLVPSYSQIKDREIRTGVLAPYLVKYQNMCIPRRSWDIGVLLMKLNLTCWFFGSSSPICAIYWIWSSSLLALDLCQTNRKYPRVLLLGKCSKRRSSWSVRGNGHSDRRTHGVVSLLLRIFFKETRDRYERLFLCLRSVHLLQSHQCIACKGAG